MSNIKYNIFYVSLKKDVTTEEAIEKLAKLPKISNVKAEKIISSENRIIKSRLNKKDAGIYRSYLDKIGLCVEIHEETEEIVDDMLVREN